MLPGVPEKALLNLVQLHFSKLHTGWLRFRHMTRSVPLGLKSFRPANWKFGGIGLSFDSSVDPNKNGHSSGIYTESVSILSPYAILDWIFCSLYLKAPYMRVKLLKNTSFDICLVKFSFFCPCNLHSMTAIIFQNDLQVWKGQKPIH